MSINKIIRAWKDSEYRSSLSEEELDSLPENPAGLTELTEEVLTDIAGGPSCVCWSCDTVGTSSSIKETQSLEEPAPC